MSENPAGPPTTGHVCAVCGRVLDYWEGRGWAHNLSDTEADHVAVPVPADEVSMRGRCDFCYVDDPEFVLPARDFEVAPGHMSRGDWAACRDCGALIERNQWKGLVTRAQRGYEERHGPMGDQVASSLPRLYRLLRKNLSGALRPL